MYWIVIIPDSGFGYLTRKFTSYYDAVLHADGFAHLGAKLLYDL